jgi:hypothetical protein
MLTDSQIAALIIRLMYLSSHGYFFVTSTVKIYLFNKNVVLLTLVLVLYIASLRLFLSQICCLYPFKHLSPFFSLPSFPHSTLSHSLSVF